MIARRAAPHPGTPTGAVVRRVTERLAHPVAQGVATAIGGVGALLTALGAEAASPDRWYPGPPGWPEAVAAPETLTASFRIGLLLLTVAWLVIGAGVREGRWTVSRLNAAAVLWALPLLVAPVALTTDVYTYLGQGTVRAAGLDPYLYGPGSVELPAMVSQGMGGAWQTSGSPYGPVFVAVAGAVAPLAVDHPAAAVLALRLVAVAGLVLVAVAVPRLARALGADPARAVWLAVASPLTLGSFVLSAHNDALMMGLLVTGLLVASLDRRIAGVPPALCGVAVCALAAMVKSPAAVAVVFVAVAWAWRAPDVRGAVARLAAAALTAAGVAAVVSAVTGVGTSWVFGGALTSPTEATTPFTPVVVVAAAVGRLAAALGGEPAAPLVLSVLRAVGAVVALGVVLVLLVRHRRVGVVRGTGLALLAVALGGPVLWPWYLTWGVVLLGAAGAGRRVRAPVVLAAVPFLTMQPDGVIGPFDTPTVLLLAVASLVLLGYAVAWCLRRLRRGPAVRDHRVVPVTATAA